MKDSLCYFVKSIFFVFFVNFPYCYLFVKRKTLSVCQLLIKILFRLVHIKIQLEVLEVIDMLDMDMDMNLIQEANTGLDMCILNQDLDTIQLRSLV